MTDTAELERRLSEAIGRNLGLRMAVAVAAPASFEENIAVLSADLAKNVIKALTPAERRALATNPQEPT